MRIKYFVVVAFLFLSFFSVKNVQAIGCVVYQAYHHICDPDGYGGQICYDEPYWENGDCGGIDNGGCGPNEHINPNGTCGQNGSGPSQGGGPAACRNATVNCAPGATISLGQPVNQECKSQWGGSFCQPIGTAQREGNIEDTCCAGYHQATTEQPYTSCDNPLIYTYACCTAGQTESCQMVDGPDVVRNLGWSGNPTYQGCWPGEYIKSWYHNSNCYSVTIDHGNDEIEYGVSVCDYSVVCGKQIQSCTCVNNCPTTTAPSGVTITDGTTQGTTVEVNWTPGIGGSAQYFWVDENQEEVDAGCPTQGDCEASRQLTAGDNFESVSDLEPSTPYYFRIVTATSGGASCPSAATSSPLTYTTPTTSGNIAGTVYLDNGNTCSTSSPTMDGVSVVLDSLTTDVSGPAGAYSFVAQMSAPHDLSVSIPAGYICANGTNCGPYPCSISGVVSPSTRNFFITANRGAWWQAMGGGVYAGSTAGGTTISSTIPSSVAAANRYLVLPGGGGTAALVMRATGDAPSVGEGEVSEDLWSAKSSYKGKKMDYAFFGAQMGLLRNQVSDWGGSGLNQQAGDSRDFWYSDPPGGSATISNPWDVDVNEQYVVFVDGDLNIDANITVADGGFLAFIVNGDVSVGSSVTDLQGIFISDNDFITESGATQLDVRGTVVAWGTTSFGRDLGTGNISSPAEKFTYRPDFLTNMPNKMKSFVMQWEEVVAGTIE